MINQSQFIISLNEDISKLDGVWVALAGELFVSNSSYLEIQGEGRKISLPIDASLILEKRLLAAKISPYMGGPYLYNDTVEIVALMAIGGNGKISISSIESGILSRNGNQYKF